jgi:hypothetical protein
MEETYPLALALYDFLPVTFFLIGAIFLVRTSIRMCGLHCGRLAIVGSLLIFLGGFLKAFWKLLFTIGVGNYHLLSESQFPLVATGFLVLLFAVIMMARSDREAKIINAASILLMSTWKIPFLIVMTLTSMGVQGILTFVSFQRKAKLAAVGFIVAFLGLVGLGALASGEQTLARQWIEQSINTVGQLGFMVGSIVLHQDVVGSQASP